MSIVAKLPDVTVRIEAGDELHNRLTNMEHKIDLIMQRLNIGNMTEEDYLSQKQKEQGTTEQHHL